MDHTIRGVLHTRLLCSKTLNSDPTHTCGSFLFPLGLGLPQVLSSPSNPSYACYYLPHEPRVATQNIPLQHDTTKTTTSCSSHIHNPKTMINVNYHNLFHHARHSSFKPSMPYTKNKTATTTCLMEDHVTPICTFMSFNHN